MDSNQLFSFLKSLTILIPLVLGLIRYNKIDESYRPFIIYLLVGFLTEVFTFIYIFGDPNKSNAAISNIYVLAEWFLILWQFYRWEFFKKSKTQLYFIIILVAGVWITENIILGKLNKDFSFYYRVLSYFVIVLMSVNIINYTIIHDNKNIFKNARFIICLGFIFVFIYKLLYEWSYQYTKLNNLVSSRNIIIASFGYVNAIHRLICAIAVLLIPRREKL